MLDQLFSTTETAASFDVFSFLICTLVSLLLGILVALVYTYRNTCNKSFVVTLAMLPAIVQMVIMLVNGNIGTGVAVMGAFSLIRFRSVPGNAKDISSIFLAMAIGLATGMGYLFAAILFAAVMIGANHDRCQSAAHRIEAGRTKEGDEKPPHHHSGKSGLQQYL